MRSKSRKQIMNNWTEKNIKELLSQGKIRGFNSQRAKNFSEGKRKVISVKPKALIWLDWNLLYWCNQRSLTLETEYRFDENRRFRFDYAIPAIHTALEFEGGIFMQKSGHNTARHYTKDTDKYNLAAVKGWRVIRVTAMNYQTVLKTLNEMVK